MNAFRMGDFNFSTSNVSMEINGSSAINVTAANPQPTDDQQLLQNVKDAMFMFQYVTLPMFLVIGLFGNLMTIATMASRQFSNLTSRYILIALAISDTTLILTQPFNKIWVINLLGTDIRSAFANLGCKIFFHIFRTSKMTSSWLVVLVCFERFVAVVFPLKAKLILKKRIIFAAIALDYLIIGSYNAVWSFSSGIVNGLCKPDLPSIEHKVFVTIGCTIYSFIPSAILLVFTPQIMYSILNQVRLRRRFTSPKTPLATTSSSSRRDEDMIRASIMVVCVMIAYIILVLPITIIHLYSAQIGVSAFDANSLGFFIFREIAQVLEQINYCINFFFYIMCSGRFRVRVFEILHLTCCYDTELSRQQTSLGSSRSKRQQSSPGPSRLNRPASIRKPIESTKITSTDDGSEEK